MRTSSFSSIFAICSFTGSAAATREMGTLLRGGVHHVPGERHHGRDAQDVQHLRGPPPCSGREQLELAPRAGEVGVALSAHGPGDPVVLGRLVLASQEEERLRERRHGPVVAEGRLFPALRAEPDHLAGESFGNVLVSHDQAEACRVDPGVGPRSFGTRCDTACTHGPGAGDRGRPRPPPATSPCTRARGCRGSPRRSGPAS